MQHYYSEDFYKVIGEYSRKSAEEIVPLVLKLIPCNQVIDVGCGDGTWLEVFKQHGVEEIVGVDGDYVSEDTLVIPKDKFISFDLQKPLQINKQFDLVISLEVAEHLPAECAQTFIDSLTSLGPVILFSAAIPYQGGENHINEQWPDYWAKYFYEKDYVVIDSLRRNIWNNKNVAYWYSQNILLFAKRTYLDTNPVLKEEFDNFVSPEDYCLAVVHPILYLQSLRFYMNLVQDMAPEKMSLRKILSLLPKATINAVQRRISLLLK